MGPDTSESKTQKKGNGNGDEIQKEEEEEREENNVNECLDILKVELKGVNGLGSWGSEGGRKKKGKN